MVNQEQEAQELTEKVLNIRYIFEKLTKQKNDMEVEMKTLEAKTSELHKTNEEYLKANREFEKKLADLNTQILAKQVELEQAQGVFKDEIDKKFAEIDQRKIEQDRRDRELAERETQIMRDEAQNIEMQKNNEASVLVAEHQEKQNALKEVELKRGNDNLNLFNEVLKKKEDGLTVKEGHLEEFNKSLLEREASVLGKLNTLSTWEMQLTQLKNAIENDRVNNLNEKNRNSYVLQVLQEMQIRCITNIGQKITEDVINKIRSSILNIEEPQVMQPSIVNKDEIIPPVVEEDEPETIPTVVVDETATIENQDKDLGEIKQPDAETIIVPEGEVTTVATTDAEVAGNTAVLDPEAIVTPTIQDEANVTKTDENVTQATGVVGTSESTEETLTPKIEEPKAEAPKAKAKGNGEGKNLSAKK